MTTSLLDVIASLGKPRVLVVGDLILDRYVTGEAGRISAEAPIPVLLKHEEESRPGGAGNVVNVLAGLDAVVSCCGVVGDDPEGELLGDLLSAKCAGSSWVLPIKGRPTSVKTRFIGYVQSAGRAMHQILRVDSEDTRPIPDIVSAAVAKFLRGALPEQDAVVVSDYAKGLFSTSLLVEVIASCRRAGVPVIVDPKPKSGQDFSAYRGATVFKPNRYETQIITGIRIHSETDMLAAARKIQGDLDVPVVLLSLDRDGMFLYETEKVKGKTRVRHAELIRANPREVSDVTGAGDVVTSMLAAVIGAKADYLAAAELSNIAADIEVGKFGVAPVSREEIAAELRLREYGVPNKLKSLPDLLGLLADHRRKEHTVVFTNGCFDLLHIGHIEYLKFARRQGDLLVVGLNSDQSVRSLKGPNRPILKQQERARVLSALEDVDYIVLFDETTPEELISQVKPDVLVKGEDWRKKGVVGREFVESYGGRVVLAPLVEGISTTDIVSRILERYGNSGN